jgi:hypothetical protein
VGVVSLGCEEWQIVGRRVDMVVVCEFGHRDAVSPVVLSIVTENL